MSETPTKYSMSKTEPADCIVLENMDKVRSGERAPVCLLYILQSLRRVEQKKRFTFKCGGERSQPLMRCVLQQSAFSMMCDFPMPGDYQIALFKLLTHSQIS